MYQVYEWRHLPTGRVYVGYAKEVQKRWAKHESADSRAPYFNTFFKKYSDLSEWFRGIVFDCDTAEEALRFESIRTRYWEKCGKRLGEELLNLRHGGNGNQFSEETRRKISEAKKRENLSEETRQRMSAAQRNKPEVSDETRKRLSDAQKKRSEESRANQREATRRRWAEYRLQKEARNALS